MGQFVCTSIKPKIGPKVDWSTDPRTQLTKPRAFGAGSPHAAAPEKTAQATQYPPPPQFVSAVDRCRLLREANDTVGLWPSSARSIGASCRTARGASAGGQRRPDGDVGDAEGICDVRTLYSISKSNQYSMAHLIYPYNLFNGNNLFM